MKVAVIGAGSWGTALSQVLATNGSDVALWARDGALVAALNEAHRNPRYLTDADLSDRIVASTSYAEALADAAGIVVVTPSNLMREVARTLDAHGLGADVPVIICSKGVEEGSGLLPAEVFESEIGNPQRIAVLSGPNHAEEVVQGIPAATVIASPSRDTALFFQNLFGCESFRVYLSDDACGVELCAAFKNVIAIAVGVSYGLGYGDNTAAVLMTRGQAEMGRLVEACGGKLITCMGLAGTGDLIATCMSRHSRNRRLGELIAAGGTLADFTEQTHMVAEGAFACRTLATLADAYRVELPITDIVRGIVWEGADPAEAARTLLARPMKAEFA